MLFSAWIARSIGLDKSKLKIPMMDFASMTYLPEIISKSYSYCVIALTKDFTLSIELREICTVFMIKNLLRIICFKIVL